MPFYYHYVFVIKCLSLIAGCNPGSLFQPSIPPLKAARFWAMQPEMDVELTAWWHREGEQIFEDSFKGDSLPATEGTQCSKGSAISPAAGDPAIALLGCSLASKQMPLLYSPTSCQHRGRVLGQSQ